LKSHAATCVAAVVWWIKQHPPNCRKSKFVVKSYAPMPAERKLSADSDQHSAATTLQAIWKPAGFDDPPLPANRLIAEG
jgi:hypothetical protein